MGGPHGAGGSRGALAVSERATVGEGATAAQAVGRMCSLTISKRVSEAPSGTKQKSDCAMWMAPIDLAMPLGEGATAAQAPSGTKQKCAEWRVSGGHPSISQRRSRRDASPCARLPSPSGSQRHRAEPKRSVPSGVSPLSTRCDGWRIVYTLTRSCQKLSTLKWGLSEKWP